MKNSNRLIEKIYNYIEENIDRQFIVFGTGNGAHRTVNILGNFFHKVICFLDNYPKKDTFYKLPVYKPTYLDDCQVKPFILVASDSYDEISVQLQLMGYEPNVDFINTLKFTEPVRDYTKKNIVNGKEIGKFTYGYESHCHRSNILKSIGSFCSINSSARIGDGNHPLDLITTHPILYMTNKDMVGVENISGISNNRLMQTPSENNGSVIIGNDVWIGANAIILPNVKIGDGAVIGAGAIITKNVDPYTVVVGAPARPLRKRFRDEEIEILLKVKWWDWDNATIKERLDLLGDPKKFFNSYRGGKFE